MHNRLNFVTFLILDSIEWNNNNVYLVAKTEGFIYLVIWDVFNDDFCKLFFSQNYNCEDCVFKKPHSSTA